MPTYEVKVFRIGYASRIIQVEADEAEEAIKKAMDEAGNYEFSEHDVDYEAEWAFPTKY